VSEPVALTVVQGGITRARVKGAALRSSLYDLVNAYVTIGKTVKVKPGTLRSQNLNTSPASVGLTSFDGTFHVFCHQPVTVPSGYVCDVLVNPSLTTDPIKKIHFAAPYMGFLYTVAEFNNGAVAHYWLQTNGTWTANTVHFNGDYVSPSAANGFAFQAVRLEPPHTVWAPENVIAVNNIIEPTIYNGYMFKAIAVTGTAPHTGSSEPAWPTTENAQIQEFGDFGTTSSATSSPVSATQAPSQSITDRYGNSATFNGITQAVETVSTLTAQTTVTTWKAGQLYQPGAVTQPSTGQGAFVNAIPNGDFEAGDDGNWTFNSPWAISSSNAYQGTKCAQFPGGVPVLQDLSGRPTGFAPRVSGNLTASYIANLPREYRLTASASGIYSSSYYYANNGTDDDLLKQGGYGRLDSQLTLESPDRRWAVDLIGKNLTDRIIVEGGTGGTSLPTSLGSTLLRKEQPRNFALQLRYHW